MFQHNKSKILFTVQFAAKKFLCRHIGEYTIEIHTVSHKSCHYETMRLVEWLLIKGDVFKNKYDYSRIQYHNIRMYT